MHITFALPLTYKTNFITFIEPYLIADKKTHTGNVMTLTKEKKLNAQLNTDLAPEID